VRRKAVSLLVKLSAESGIIPRDLFIQVVDIGEDRGPWEAGGFADVFRGTYNGQKVAVKRLRIFNADKPTINPVGVFFGRADVATDGYAADDLPRGSALAPAES
jgi:hypothetical protein